MWPLRVENSKAVAEMAWLFASVVLVLMATIPGWKAKVGIALLALVMVFFMTIA